MNLSGNLAKMRVELTNPIHYFLPLSESELYLNDLIGQSFTLRFTGEINCVSCQRKIRKSFNQGHCYACFRRLPQCDICIVKPEHCHYEAGTCRDEQWGEQHCLQPHYIYLANSSGLKVGITRGTQIPTRWIDQGAVQALPIIEVSERLLSGLVEVELKKSLNDKTSWQKMLKGHIERLDLESARDAVFAENDDFLANLQQQWGEDAIGFLHEEESIEIHYPVLEYPKKVVSFNFDKNPEVSGKLKGIKGQYLIFDTGVINIRKFSGYHVEVIF